MTHCILLGLSALMWAPCAFSAQPIVVICGDGATELERYASAELVSYLGRIASRPVSVSSGEGTLLLVGREGRLAGFEPKLPDLEEQELCVRSGVLDGTPAVAVTGGSPQAVLWAAYALLEHFGCLFEFTGDTLPPIRDAIDFTGLDLRQKPCIAQRGLRLHLNFPMDQSAYPLDEFLAWVDRMARMKLNYLMFHFYSAHPWFQFSYKGAQTTTGTFFVGSQMFGGRYGLADDMIGRALVRNQAVFFPPEMEGMAQGVELYRRTEERMRAVMQRAKDRGMTVAVSFEPLSPPGDIGSHLAAWEQEAGGRDALMRDLTARRLLACMDAYPQADEYQLISVEGSNDAPEGLDLKAELGRICGKYAVPFDPDDESTFAGAKEAGVHLTPYNAPAAAEELDRGLYRPVVSTLRYVDLALDVLGEARVRDRLQKEAKLGNVGIYLPHAAAVKLCTPALRVMTPPGGRLQLMVDYGARATADQMPTWDAFTGADMQLGVITWLEFDGSMFMPQAWPRAVYDCVDNARGLPLTTLVANHWRVSGLQADAACLAEAPWQGSDDFDAWWRGYLTRVFGRQGMPTALTAYDYLEQATLYCRAHLFNVGFCWEGRWRQGFGYSPEHLKEAERLFSAAALTFEHLADATTGSARARAGYLANRCRCGALHMQTVAALAAAEAGPGDAPERLAHAAVEAQTAVERAEEYMATYAERVDDRGDEGMLVNYHFAVVNAAHQRRDAVRQHAVLAACDPDKPVMHFGFEGDGTAILADATGNGFNARAQGTLSAGEGKVGRGLVLDGKTYLVVDGASAFNPESFTISAWVRPTRTTHRRGLVVKRVGNTAAPFVLGISDGALRFEGCGTGGAFWPFNFSGPEIPAGRWTHVAVVLQTGKEITLYADGQPVAHKDLFEAPQPNGEPIVIGKEAWGGEDGPQSPAFFVGGIDEVKLWKRALSAEEVAREADAAAGGHVEHPE